MPEQTREIRADFEKKDSESSLPMIIEFVRSILDPKNRKVAIWRLAEIFLWFTAVSYVFYSPAAIGQPIASGLRTAII
jgi:hypothetical protein